MDSALLDVVHVHHPFPLSASAVFAARKRGIPVAATNHTIPECSLWGIRGSGPVYSSASAAFGRWIAFLMRRCDTVATPTRTAAGKLSSMGFRGSVVVISNGVDTARFSTGPEDPTLRARLGLDGRPVVLYTGRLDAEKQMDVWLETAWSLRDLEVQFVVGGEGGDRRRLEGRARDLGLGGHVRFIGFLDDELFPALYRLAAAYLITSPVELQSITTLEAMASGLPVVACRSGALPELVHEGHNGWLFQPGDWMAAASGLRRILTDRERAAEMGRHSAELAAGHRLELSLAAYEQFLERAVHARRGEPRVERAAAART
jgi:glycosyltransferase involved in cell wall biosynthesis